MKYLLFDRKHGKKYKALQVKMFVMPCYVSLGCVNNGCILVLLGYVEAVAATSRDVILYS
jgi:hypothetical protein